MARKIVLASELIAQLQLLVEKHGDLPVLFAVPDEGTFDVEPPVFDSDGAGDNCFII